MRQSQVNHVCFFPQIDGDCESIYNNKMLKCCVPKVNKPQNKHMVVSLFVFVFYWLCVQCLCSTVAVCLL